MSASAVVDIRNTYGAVFIGLLVSTLLNGVTVTQTWIYYWHYRSRDSTALKGFVALLFVLDTAHMALCIYSVYWYLILNFGNIANLDINMWVMNIGSDVISLAGYLVQLFYARRIYIMSKSLLVPMTVAVFGGLCFVLGFVYTAKAAELKRFSRFHSLTWVTCTAMSSSVLADILIAMAMCWCLYHRRTGFAKTDSMIMTLMLYSINSGLLTSILATSMLITFVTVPNSLISMMLFWLMGKCYVNSFLAILNNRDSLRERCSDDSSISFAMPSIRQGRTTYKSNTGPTAVTVTTHQTTTSMDLETRTHDQDNELELEKTA